MKYKGKSLVLEIAGQAGLFYADIDFSSGSAIIKPAKNTRPIFGYGGFYIYDRQTQREN
jgi:hypothetical protein